MFEGLRNGMARGFKILAQRVSTEPRDPDEMRLYSSPRTLAGVTITPDTAVTVGAVWGCLTYISESVAGLPWHVHKRTKEGNEEQPSHPVDWLLWKRPALEWSSFQFRETLLHWALRWGNGYAEIERDTVGRPIGLWPIHPDRVDVCRDTETGRLYYEVNNFTGGKVEIDMMDMFHLRGFGEGPVGVNVIHYAAQSIGWAKAAQLFGASFFGNGATPAIVIKNKKALGVDGLKRQRAEFDGIHRGPYRANRTAILDLDADIERIGLNAAETQLIEVHRMLVEEVCRFFRVPPHIVAELSRSTNNNIEHQGIEAVQRCLTPWVQRFEAEADFKLFGQNRRNLYTKINMLGLLRGDFKSQAEGFKVYREMGVMNGDEIRARLEMNRMAEGEGGEKYTMNGAYTTLAKVGEQPVAEPSPPEPPQPDPVEDDAAAAARAQFAALMEPANV